MNPVARSVGVKWIPHLPYAQGLALQSLLVQQRVAGLTPDLLLLCQHPPTYTAGRRLSQDAETHRRLQSLGADTVQTLRGGQWTFHGPGQLMGVRAYVEALQDVLMATCRDFGIHGSTTSDVGVWIDSRKIAALGIHVARYVTSHGFALNVCTDLTWFDHIVPCGLPDKQVTSMATELARLHKPPGSVQVASVMPTVERAFAERFECSVAALDFVDPRLDQAIDAFLGGQEHALRLC